MIRKKSFITILLLAVGLTLAGLWTAHSADRPVSVQAQVDKDEVTVGESFILQIKVDGDDSPAEPDLSGLQDFTVEPRGGGRNNRESISIINGKMNRISEHGYVFRYELTPKKEGTLTIPVIAISAGGKALLTQPIAVRVAEPVVTDEFKLRITLSETECYVGQPLVLTVKWYVNTNIEEFNFALPFLEDQRFTFDDLPEDSNYQGQDAISINLPGGTVIARKGREGQFTTVTLCKILIPRRPGEFTLGRGKVNSKIISGYRQGRGGAPGNDLFNRDLFNDFFNRRQPVYQQLVTESNELQVKVLPLPEEKRPPDFSGLVGQYSLAVEASPREVNVGDPITLHIMVTGGEYLGNVVFPPLDSQPEIRDNFKVPREMSPGEIDGRVKTFTQTIRAKNISVKEIPAIRLNYFNPETGEYDFAATKAIPLQVGATKIITAGDAEGIAPGPAKKELTSSNKGIAYNYVGEDVLKNQEIAIGSWFGSPAGLALILFPPVVYLLVLVPFYYRRKRLQNSEKVQSRKALPEFLKKLARLQQEIQQNEPRQTAGSLVDAMRVYFGKRLHMPPGGLVYTEVAERLRQQGAKDALLAELQKILEWCEAYHYGAMNGNNDREDLRQMLAAASTLFQKIDQGIR